MRPFLLVQDLFYIRRVIFPVVNLGGCKIKWIERFNAASIEANFVWIAASLVMRVYPAYTAKVMFRHMGVELVKRQLVRTFQNTKIFQPCAGHKGGFSSA